MPRHWPLLVSLALLLPWICFCDAADAEQTCTDRKELLTRGISGAILVEQIKHLAAFSSDVGSDEGAPPAVTRLLFSREDVAARRYVKHLMREAGLRVHEDAVGNIFGVWNPEEEGDESDKNEEETTTTAVRASTTATTATPNAVALPRNLVLSGSHTDAIPLAGAYDGVVGVLGAIAAIGSLRNASLFRSSSSSSNNNNDNNSSSSFRPRKPLAAVMFTSEEPTRFGLSCLGSRALAGELRAKELASLRDVAVAAASSTGGGGDGGGGGGGGGAGFFELADAAGVPRAVGSKSDDDLSRAEATLSSVRLVKEGDKRKKKNDPLPSVSSFVELHIEQAATLEGEGSPLGVVTAIAAPAALDVTFRGPGGHAGSLPMRLRADAGLAAAAFALDVEAIALDASLGRGEEERKKSGEVIGGGGDDSVATVGMVSFSPGAVNSVPREARVSVDVRDVDGARRDRMLRRIKEAAARRASERRGQGNGARVEVDVRTVSEDAPATAGEEVVRAAERAVVQVTGAVREGGEEERRRRRRQGSISSRLVSFVSKLFFAPFSPPPPPPLLLLPSRAYHDALFMSRVTRQTGMIFVRCRGGWSHRPDEFASEEDIEAGVEALALALAELAEGDAGAGGGGGGR